MKLRFENNSIRLRVKKSDIQKLNTEGVIEELVAIAPGATFIYKLRLDPKGTNIHAHLKDRAITVCIPEQQGRHWIQSEEVGVEITQQLDEKNQLYILIEKDFPCKDRPEEDQSDTFKELADKEENPAC